MDKQEQIQPETAKHQGDNFCRLDVLVGLPNILYQKEPNSIWYSNEKLKCSNCKKEVEKLTAIKLSELSDEFYFCDGCQPAAIQMAFALNPSLENILIRAIVYETNPLEKKNNRSRKREPIGLALRFKVMQRDKFKCVICGKNSDDAKLEIDHIIPVAAGGKTVHDNLQTLCFDCNRGKRTDFM